MVIGQSGGMEAGLAFASPEARARVIRPIALEGAFGGALRMALEQAAAQLDISSRTARRLYDRLRESGGRLSSIVPRARGPKKGSRRLDAEREALLGELLEKTYLQREKMSFRRAVREIRGEFIEAGLQPPTRRTVKARLDAMDRYEVERKRNGAKAARERFQPAIGGLKAKAPLDVVQMDHTLADIILVDSVERQPFRRPWVTFAIDVATRMVTGVHVTFDAPSALSNALCLDHSVREKSDERSPGGVARDWPAFGVPKRIHVDNGADFRSQSFEDGCREWGIELEFRPRGRPHYGGHIERLIGTAMGAVHLLPGTTDASPAKKGDYDSVGNAALTLEEFRQWLFLEIRRYHNTPHSSLKAAPIDKWVELKGDETIRRPGAGDAFMLSFMPMKRRRLTREGVSLFGIKYWSDAFAGMVGRFDAPFTVKYDPRHLSKIWLCVDDGRMIEARYRNISHPDISLWEYEAARRAFSKHSKARLTERLLFDIVAEQRRIAATAQRLTKSSRMARERDLAGPSDKQAERPEARRMVAIDTSSSSLEPFEVEEFRDDRSTHRKNQF